MSAARPDTPPRAAAADALRLAGSTVLVVGLGDSGLAMARWAASQRATVRVVDSRAQSTHQATLHAEVPQACFTGGVAFEPELLDGIDALLWSPGLSIETGPAAGLYAAARARNLPVLGEIELFARALATMRDDGYAPALLAITGTNGKTTTTRLAGHLCESAGRSVMVAGNIAPAALDALRGAIASDTLPDVWVLELSSFQLALTDSLRADAAAILNISQDHLDWHRSMDSYAQAKQRIHRHARVSVHGRDDPATMPAQATDLRSFGLSLPTLPGEWGIVHEGGLRWLAQACVLDAPAAGRRRRAEAPEVTVRRLMPVDALLIRGAHNQANALAALALADAIGIPVAAMLHGLRSFAGEPHRCQCVATCDEVAYFDDSKGTNVGATVAALTGLGRPCVLIAGGDGKGQDFSPLETPVRGHARAVVLIGRDAPRLREALAATGVPLHDAPTLEAAVEIAAALARPGDAVLLSPACASFDMFRGYAHRAEVFVDAVRRRCEEAGQPC